MKTTMLKTTIGLTVGLAVGLAVMVLATSQVAAQGTRNCAPREIVLERLAEKYGETRQSLGLGANNAVVEVFASTDTGSWTLRSRPPTG